MNNKLKIKLDNLYKEAISIPLEEQQSDPLQVAKLLEHPIDILVCALFSYGNAKQIVKFLNQINFKNINETDNIKYRFQTIADVKQILDIAAKIKLNDLFDSNQLHNEYKLNGIQGVISYLQQLFYDNLEKSNITKGILFYLGKPIIEKSSKGAYKRYNMYLRWMVRNTDFDLGYWSNIIDKADLIIPLDTHIATQCKEFGFITNKNSTWNNATLITEKLKKYDNLDPIKYDFAIYRMGQSESKN